MLQEVYSSPTIKRITFIHTVLLLEKKCKCVLQVVIFLFLAHTGGLHFANSKLVCCLNKMEWLVRVCVQKSDTFMHH